MAVSCVKFLPDGRSIKIESKDDDTVLEACLLSEAGDIIGKIIVAITSDDSIEDLIDQIVDDFFNVTQPITGTQIFDVPPDDFQTNLAGESQTRLNDIDIDNIFNSDKSDDGSGEIFKVVSRPEFRRNILGSMQDILAVLDNNRIKEAVLDDTSIASESRVDTFKRLIGMPTQFTTSLTNRSVSSSIPSGIDEGNNFVRIFFDIAHVDQNASKDKGPSERGSDLLKLIKISMLELLISMRSEVTDRAAKVAVLRVRSLREFRNFALQRGVENATISNDIGTIYNFSDAAKTVSSSVSGAQVIKDFAVSQEISEEESQKILNQDLGLDDLQRTVFANLKICKTVGETSPEERKEIDILQCRLIEKKSNIEDVFKSVTDVRRDEKLKSTFFQMFAFRTDQVAENKRTNARKLRAMLRDAYKAGAEDAVIDGSRFIGISFSDIIAHFVALTDLSFTCQECSNYVSETSEGSSNTQAIKKCILGYTDGGDKNKSPDSFCDNNAVRPGKDYPKGVKYLISEKTASKIDDLVDKYKSLQNLPSQSSQDQ